MIGRVDAREVSVNARLAGSAVAQAASEQRNIVRNLEQTLEPPPVQASVNRESLGLSLKVLYTSRGGYLMATSATRRGNLCVDEWTRASETFTNG